VVVVSAGAAVEVVASASPLQSAKTVTVVTNLNIVTGGGGVRQWRECNLQAHAQREREV